jgi:hypothetical protein
LPGFPPLAVPIFHPPLLCRVFPITPEAIMVQGTRSLPDQRDISLRSIIVLAHFGFPTFYLHSLLTQVGVRHPFWESDDHFTTHLARRPTSLLIPPLQIFPLPLPSSSVHIRQIRWTYADCHSDRTAVECQVFTLLDYLSDDREPLLHWPSLHRKTHTPDGFQRNFHHLTFGTHPSSDPPESSPAQRSTLYSPYVLLRRSAQRPPHHGIPHPYHIPSGFRAPH